MRFADTALLSFSVFKRLFWNLLRGTVNAIQSSINYIISVQLQLNLQICQMHYNYNYYVLKTSNYNYFHTCNRLQVEITNSFKNMKITCRQVGIFPEVVPEQAFCELSNTAFTTFFIGFQQFFPSFDTSRIPHIHRAAVCGAQNMAPHVNKWPPLDGAHE